MTSQNFKKDYLFNSIGTTLNSFVTLFLMVAITRINGIDDAGLFSFVIGIVLIFFALALYGGRTYQVSDVKNEFESREYIILKIITSSITLLIALIFCAIHQYDLQKTLFIISLLIFKIMDAISDSIYGVIQKRNKLYLAGISNTVKTMVGMICFIAVDLISKNVVISSLAIIIINLLVIFFFDIPQMRKLEHFKVFSEVISKCIKDSKTILQKNFYVFIPAFLTVFIINAPKYFVDSFHPEDNGYYGAVIMPASFIVLLAQFIIMPLVVNQANNLKTNFIQFCATTRKVLLIIIALGCLITAIAYLLAAPVLSIVFGLPFYDYTIDITFVIVGGVIYSLSYIYAFMLTIMRKMKIQIAIYVATIIVELIIGYILIVNFSIHGAVTLYVLLNILQTLLFFIAYARGIRMHKVQQTQK